MASHRDGAVAGAVGVHVEDEIIDFLEKAEGALAQDDMSMAADLYRQAAESYSATTGKGSGDARVFTPSIAALILLFDAQPSLWSLRECISWTSRSKSTSVADDTTALVLLERVSRDRRRSPWALLLRAQYLSTLAHVKDSAGTVQLCRAVLGPNPLDSHAAEPDAEGMENDIARICGLAMLGRCLALGDGCIEDPAYAVTVLHAAAQKGHAGARRELAQCYELGRGTTLNINEALFFYRAASALGHVQAMDRLGLLLLKTASAQSSGASVGTSMDAANTDVAALDPSTVVATQQEAVKWFTEASGHGFGLASFHLASCHRSGKGVPQNANEAMRLTRVAAVDGVVNAQYNLGLSLWRGMGVPQDTTEALHWLVKAAYSGHADATKFVEASRSTHRSGGGGGGGGGGNLRPATAGGAGVGMGAGAAGTTMAPSTTANARAQRRAAASARARGAAGGGRQSASLSGLLPSATAVDLPSAAAVVAQVESAADHRSMRPSTAGVQRADHRRSPVARSQTTGAFGGAFGASAPLTDDRDVGHGGVGAPIRLPSEEITPPPMPFGNLRVSPPSPPNPNKLFPHPTKRHAVKVRASGEEDMNAKVKTIVSRCLRHGITVLKAKRKKDCTLCVLYLSSPLAGLVSPSPSYASRSPGSRRNSIGEGDRDRDDEHGTNMPSHTRAKPPMYPPMSSRNISAPTSTTAASGGGSGSVAAYIGAMSAFGGGDSGGGGGGGGGGGEGYSTYDETPSEPSYSESDHTLTFATAYDHSAMTSTSQEDLTAASRTPPFLSWGDIDSDYDEEDLDADLSLMR